MRRRDSGFTIVELLIVIVVIGILAAITIVAYNGIQGRAQAATVSTALAQTSKKLALYVVDNGAFPVDLTAVGISGSNGTSYQYSVNNGISPQTYCVTATNGTTSYKVSSTTTAPSSGGCAGHGVGGVGAVTNMVINPSFEVDISGWSANLSSLQRVSTGGNQGASKLSLTKTLTGDSYAHQVLTGVGVANRSYTLSFWVWSDSAVALSSSVGLQESGGTYRWIMNQAGITATASPVRYVITGIAPVDVFGNLRIILRTGPDVNNVVYYDGFMLTEGSTVYGYADGSSPNWLWNGTANNSTSTGPAL